MCLRSLRIPSPTTPFLKATASQRPTTTRAPVDMSAPTATCTSRPTLRPSRCRPTTGTACFRTDRSARLRRVRHDATEVRRGLTRQTHRHVPLPVPCATRQLQVALEHLGHAVHAAVAQRAPTRQRWDGARSVAVDAAGVHETVRFAGRAEAQRLEPEPHERRKAVVDLGQVYVGDGEPSFAPEPLDG